MSVLKYNHSGGGSETGSRALAKTANSFRNDSQKANVRIRQSAVNAIIASKNPTTLDELMRHIIEETRKPSQDRIVAFNQGILSEATTSAVYSDFLKPKDGSNYAKTDRMILRSGQADSKDGRADNSPNKNPAKTADIKIQALTIKKKLIKKI